MIPRLTTTVFIISSFALTALTIGNAFVLKKQFFPSIVYLTKSSASMAVIYLQAIVFVAILFQLLKTVMFGQLRAAETENLTERAWFAITETCLAFTVFRDDFSPRFVMQFVVLLFVKCFHWLNEDRVDSMERIPVLTVLFHVRMMALVALLSSIDSYFMSHAYFSTLLHGASVQLVFGFEYAILFTTVLHVVVKYLLHMHDMRNVHPWENKAVLLLHTELLVSLLRCALYSTFVVVMIRLHTFPLFSVRPFYLTCRAFKKALHDVVMSRRAIHAMNTLFPMASQDDLDAGGDNTCIICRDEMTVAVGGAKKLPCQHIFHAACLRSWFQRQQSCPTCRADILTTVTVDHRQSTPAPTAPQQPPNVGVPPFGVPPFGVPPVGVPPFGVSPVGVPPFGFSPPFPMMPPIPFPTPPSLAGLSDDEVRLMEGRERLAVEARIRSLRNIGVLLDAAAVQLQQYTSILGALSATVAEPPSEANIQPQPQSDPGPSTSQTTEEQIRQRRLDKFDASV